MATKMANDALVRNLRFKYKNRIENYSDKVLIKAYDNWATSEDYNSQDEDGFLEWIEVEE